ncbi:MAG: FAD-binding protein [Proteobacteria bacterium]|nr:FAD-binding protein [Pseudomonadota bacterium]
MPILVIAEHDNARLNPATLSTVAAGLEIAGKTGEATVTLLVAGHNAKPVAEAAAKVTGVGEVLYADAPNYAHAIAEYMGALIVSLADDYSHILAPATSFGKNILPGVAAKKDVAQISDIIRVDGADTFQRPIYASNALAVVRSRDSLKVITTRSTAFDPVADSGGSASIKTLEAKTDDGAGKTSFVKAESSQSERPSLTSARIVISGGRGMQSGDNFAMLDSIAEKLNAAVGASRAAVDAGFIANEYQVGQTGKVVAPDLYIAVGISGAIQHLAGMKDSKVIVAINKDKDAPIFQVADYGLVADLFEALPEFEKHIS